MLELNALFIASAASATLAVARLVDGAVEGVLLTAALLGALGFLWHRTRQAIRFGRKIKAAVDGVLELVSRFEPLEDWAQAHGYAPPSQVEREV